MFGRNRKEQGVPAAHPFRLARNEEPENPTTPARGIIHRNILTVVLSGASLLFAGAVSLTSLYIFKNGLQDLQRSQTGVQYQTEKKLLNETAITAAEAKFAPLLSQARAENEVLRVELTRTQTALAESETALADARIGLAHAEKGKADADARLARFEGDLKNFNVKMAELTTGNRQFQEAVGRWWKHSVVPVAECMSPNPGELSEAFKKRCEGKGFDGLLSGFDDVMSTSPPQLSPPRGGRR